MNAYDELVAKFILTKFRSYKTIPWAAVGGSVNSSLTHEAFTHLKECAETTATVTDTGDGPTSDVTPDPKMWLSSIIQCPHSYQTKYDYTEYGSLNEFIAWIEKGD